MTRKWAPQTRYTFRRYIANIIKDLIWFNAMLQYLFVPEILQVADL